MTIYRSPFSAKTPVPQPVAGGAAAPTSTGGTVRNLKLTPSAGTNEKVDKKKTSFDEEKLKLDKAVSSIKGKIASGSGDYAALTAEAESIAAGKPAKSWFDKGAFGFIKEAGKFAVEPFAYTLGLSKVRGSDVKSAITYPGRQVQTALDYALVQPASNATQVAIAATQGKGKETWKRVAAEVPTPAEALKRARDPEWSLKKEARYQTGNKAVDTVTGLTIDILADPATYTGVGEMKYAGRVGREVLALKFAEKKMLDKYPEMINNIDNIVRYGENAIPQAIREAEGIKTGIRFGGQIIPNTTGAAAAVAAPITGARTAIGDVLYRFAPEIQFALAPASRKAGVAFGVGRNLNTTSGEDVVTRLVDTTAQRAAKGRMFESYGKWARDIKGTLKDAKDMKVTEKIVHMVEDPVEYAKGTAAEQAIADSFSAWQKGIRDEVNAIYQDFAQKFNVDVTSIGFVDDYVHHKITDEARDWVFNKGKNSKLWKPDEITVSELTGNIGAVRYRKLSKGEEFMGEVLQTGSIKEINEISMRNAGVKWFETDLGSIADSYAYSLSKTRGREAWATRMMDFGPKYIRPMIKQSVPDEELVKRLVASHQKLVDSEKFLRRAVSIGGKTVADYGRRSISLAEKVLKGKAGEVIRNAQEIAKVKKILAEVEDELAAAYALAGTKTGAERGAFADAHKALYSLRRRLQTAVDVSGSEQTAALQVLREHYMELFPNAKNVPDNPEKLAEAILRRNKIAVARESKEIESRIEILAQQLDELPPNSEAIRNEMMQEMDTLKENLSGFDELAMVRLDASYAPDGLMYGYVDDLLPLPENTVPYKKMTTYRPDKNFNKNPDSIVMHALDETSLIDLRKPDDFRAVWGDENMPIIIEEALNYAGFDGTALKEMYMRFKETGQIDDMFREIYPDETRLIETLDDFANLPVPEGEISNDILKMVFDDMDNVLRGIASRYGFENSDLVAQQMMDDILGGIIAFSDGNGMLVPAHFVEGEIPELADNFAVLVAPTWGDKVPPRGQVVHPTASVQRVVDSDFAQRILEDGYETVNLSDAETFSTISDDLMMLEGTAGRTEALKSQKRSLSAQKGAVTAKGSRRTKATQAAVEQWNKSNTFNVVINGKRTTLTRDKAVELLASTDKQVAAAEARLQKVIAKIESDAGVNKLLKKQATYQERLPMLFNQAEVLQRWTDETGVLLQNEVDNIRELINQRPSKGSAAMQTHAWQQKVDRSIQSIGMLPPVEAKAYKRVVTQLHADETKMAWLSYMGVPASSARVTAAKSGYLGGTLQYQASKGWDAIAALGVEVPEELISLWKPQLEKLVNPADRNMFLRAYDTYNVFFKQYAMLSTGFSVRNAMSATFMNWVAGVPTKEMMEGVRVANAIRKHGNGWLDALGLTGGMRDLYETAWRATETTGRGFGDELAEPVIGRGWAEKIINNKLTQLSQKLNEFTERAVRLPMALDSLQRGHSYDEAIARISRYHFDYSDVSKLDETMKKFIPFWIWTSRNLPLQISTQWTRPSAYMTYSKIQQELPVDEDVMLPKWLATVNPMGVGGSTVLAPDMPMGRLSQTIDQLNPFNLKFLGSVTPALKVPIELAWVDKQSALDIPFSDKLTEAKGIDVVTAWLGDKLNMDQLGMRDPTTGKLMVSSKAQYALGAVLPPVSKVQRLSGGLAGGKESYMERLGTSWMNEFGVPVREVGPDQQRGEAINRQMEIAKFAKLLERHGQIKKKSD